MLLEQPETLCSYPLNFMSIHLIYWTSCEVSFAPLLWAQSKDAARMGKVLWCRMGNVSGLGAAGGHHLDPFYRQIH